jgi:TolB-like protein
VHEHVAGKLAIGFDDLGLRETKNSSRPVRVFEVRTNGREAEQTTQQPTRTALSIAVLPFDNLSGDADQQYLSDGITEDITTELSRFRNLSVAARTASFHYRGKNLGLAQVARELGVNYVVEGSVRKAGARIRITTQLIDARTGDHVWAERYDRESGDVFAVQDEVVSAIAATLEGRMTAAAAGSTRKKPTSSWSAYDFLLQGRELCNANKEAEALPLFARATAIDPKFAQAHAWLAIGLLATYWFDADTRTLNEAAQVAQQALALDSSDSTVHHANAMVMVWLRQYERASMHFDRAIALNPANIEIRADRANLLRYTNRPEEALAVIDDALKRTPFPPSWFWRLRGAVLLQLKRYSEAVSSFHNLPEPDHFGYAYLAAAHSYLGDRPAAAQALAKAAELRPSISLRDFSTIVPHVGKEALDHLLDGLRNAGMPQ